MAHVIFYENPDCAEHARQKALLMASGHTVEARDLLAEPWSVSSLRPYFAEKSIRDWFNPISPRLKQSDIDLDTITPQAALVAMILDPLLIRAPLMRIGDRCEAGFDAERVHGWIGLAPSAKGPAVVAPIPASLPIFKKTGAEAAK
jgi:nitrogenase-associated protein